MNIDQALQVLARLEAAAPPTTAARLGEVIAVVQALADAREQPVAPAPDPAAELVTRVYGVLYPSLVFVRDQAQALRAGRLGQITTEQMDSLAQMDDHTSAALALLGTVSDITDLQNGELQIEPTEFSSLDLLAEAWQRAYTAAEQHEHQISVHADDPLPTVIGDYNQILTILDDLLDNAIRYTPFGGIIRITAELLGEQVLFSIADNGIGLNRDDQGQIGQPFWRAQYQPLVRQYAGGGLRLYRAQQILELHDSTLFFSGEPSMGSTFSFTLPAAK